MSKRSCHPYHIFESIEMAPKLLQEIFDDQGLCEQLAEIVAEKDIRAVVCVGTGSSYLAAYSQAFAVKELIGIFSEAINSTDFRLFCPAYLDEHTLVVVNSHSGKSPGDVETETIAKGRGAYVVAVTDIEGDTARAGGRLRPARPRRQEARAPLHAHLCNGALPLLHLPRPLGGVSGQGGTLAQLP